MGVVPHASSLPLGQATTLLVRLSVTYLPATDEADCNPRCTTPVPPSRQPCSALSFGNEIAFSKGMAKVLMIHPEKCTGCQNCMLACSLHHEGQFRMAASRVHVYTWEREGISVHMMCQQCDTAACMKVCPTGALHRTPGELLVDFSQNKCIGCHMCTIACPFGNMVYDAIAASPLKCDTCGGDPSCAKYCPTHAIEWVDDNISTRDRKKNYAAKFKIAFGEGGL